MAEHEVIFTPVPEDPNKFSIKVRSTEEEDLTEGVTASEAIPYINSLQKTRTIAGIVFTAPGIYAIIDGGSRFLNVSGEFGDRIGGGVVAATGLLEVAFVGLLHGDNVSPLKAARNKLQEKINSSFSPSLTSPESPLSAKSIESPESPSRSS